MKKLLKIAMAMLVMSIAQPATAHMPKAPVPTPNAAPEPKDGEKPYKAFLPKRAGGKCYSLNELRALNPTCGRPEYMQWLAEEVNTRMGEHLKLGADGEYHGQAKNVAFSIPAFTAGSMDTFWTFKTFLVKRTYSDTVRMYAVHKTTSDIVPAAVLLDGEVDIIGFDLADVPGMGDAKATGWSFQFDAARATCANLISGRNYYRPVCDVPRASTKIEPYTQPTRNPQDDEYDEGDDEYARYNRTTNNYYNNYYNSNSGYSNSGYGMGFSMGYTQPYYYGNQYAQTPPCSVVDYPVYYKQCEGHTHYVYVPSAPAATPVAAVVTPVRTAYQPVQIHSGPNPGPTVINTNPHTSPPLNGTITTTNDHTAPGTGGDHTVRTNPGLNTDAPPATGLGKSPTQNTRHYNAGAPANQMQVNRSVENGTVASNMSSLNNRHYNVTQGTNATTENRATPSTAGTASPGRHYDSPQTIANRTKMQQGVEADRQRITEPNNRHYQNPNANTVARNGNGDNSSGGAGNRHYKNENMPTASNSRHAGHNEQRNGDAYRGTNDRRSGNPSNQPGSSGGRSRHDNFEGGGPLVQNNTRSPRFQNGNENRNQGNPAFFGGNRGGQQAQSSGNGGGGNRGGSFGGGGGGNRSAGGVSMSSVGVGRASGGGGRR